MQKYFEHYELQRGVDRVSVPCIGSKSNTPDAITDVTIFGRDRICSGQYLEIINVHTGGTGERYELTLDLEDDRCTEGWCRAPTEVGGSFEVDLPDTSN